MKLDRVIAVRNNKTIFRDGERCIKVFNTGFSKADVLNEALNQARIEETGLNIPKVLEVTMIDGKWAIVFDFIKGKTLAQLMEERSEKKQEYIDLLAKLHISVHEKTCPLLNKLNDKISSRITEAELDADIRYNLQNMLENMPRQNSLCHGDFNPSNVIVADSGVPYVIDWAHATQGNPFADVALTYLLLSMDGDDSIAELYLDTFCKKKNTTKQYVQEWIPIVAASQSVKSNKKQREFMISRVNIANNR